jgi:hypothetical protein
MASALLPLKRRRRRRGDYQRIVTMRCGTLQDAYRRPPVLNAVSRLPCRATRRPAAPAVKGARGAWAALEANISNRQPAEGLQWDLATDPAGTGELVMTTRGQLPLAFAG